jgi:23S rRNA (pseudouridine1915-N3)-methyltransferase
MMAITIIGVGRLKERYWVDAAAEYLKRLNPYAKLNLHEVADEKAPETMSPAQQNQVMSREGERILALVRPQTHMIALAIGGSSLTSEQFATYLDKQAAYTGGDFTFVIGGSLGLAPAVLARADYKLSFGALTYPHQLMRIMLLEQIYRAFRINRGEPYHK